ncbi:MAG: hypothetical protein ACI9HK_004190, partial [Pirellulaceae bacterium]
MVIYLTPLARVRLWVTGYCNPNAVSAASCRRVTKTA